MQLDDEELDKNYQTHMVTPNLIREKEDNTTRLMFMNVRGLPTSNHHPKKQEIYGLVHDSEVDIRGLVEVNTNWMEVLYHH